MSAFSIRPFVDSDLPACLGLARPDGPPDAAELETARRADADWSPRYHRARHVAEDEGGAVVGWGEISHVHWSFHPDKYHLSLEVAPARRRLGAGGLLLERMAAELRSREALLVRALADEENTEAIGFLTHRGFCEVWRELMSRLDVAAFDPAPFTVAAGRAEQQGVTITTLDAELARDPSMLRELYEVYMGSQSDEQLDTLTARPFEEFVASEVYGPQAMSGSWFLGRVRGRLAGLSHLESRGDPEGVDSGYTGVLPAYRNRGIALALKLRTIEYVRGHGYRYIHTGSNAVNTRMLGINAALGFEPLPARITFELRLA